MALLGIPTRLLSPGRVPDDSRKVRSCFAASYRLVIPYMTMIRSLVEPQRLRESVLGFEGLLEACGATWLP